MREAFVLAAVLFLGAGAARAGALEERFESAARAYEKGDYEAAEREYRGILERGVRAPEVYYNLANTSFRLGRLGQAILNYERALRLDPRDPDARHNLEYCRRQIADRDEPSRHWIEGAYEGWTRLVGADGEAWLLLVVYVPGMAALGVYVAARRDRARRAGRFAAAALLTLAVPAAALVAVRLRQESGNPAAIVQQQRVEGRSGPGEDNAVLFTVHEGLRVQVRNQDREWTQVLLPNGLNGWIPADSLEII